MGLDLDHARRVAVEAAEAAGLMMRDASRDDIRVCAKDDTGDVVTELDVAAERLIIDRLRGAFPTHPILAEESGLLDAPDGAHVWLVDPLDGTNNLAIGLHAYVIGIALCEEKRPLLGVVHDPIGGQSWSAVRGRGAVGPGLGLNARRRPPAGCSPVVAWTQGYGVGRDDATARSLRLVLESNARRVLQLWAPLLSWVMLARGAIDGFVGYRADGVDLPAGALIAREAGVVVCGLDGSFFDEPIDGPQEDRSFVAARPEIIRELLEWLGSAASVRADLARLLSK
jgi:myo-inositol-1(or 4)-monophosphatase